MSQNPDYEPWDDKTADLGPFLTVAAWTTLFATLAFGLHLFLTL